MFGARIVFNPQTRERWLQLISYHGIEVHILAKRKKDFDHHLNSAAQLLLLMAALERGDFAKALKLAKQLMKSHPEEASFPALAARCMLDLGRTADAEQLVLSALDRFPGNAELLHNLGVALVELEKPEEAETHLRKAIESTAQRDTRDRAQTYCKLGEALWMQARMEEAVAAWREALVECPGHEDAQRYLKEQLNEHGEPKAPTRAFDDLYHFNNIQTARYFRLQGKEVFENVAEANRVVAFMQEAWNDHIVHRVKDLDAMTAAEKTALFSSITVDFSRAPRTENLPIVSPMAADTEDDEPLPTPEELALVEMFDRAFPFLPSGSGGLVILYGLPALVATGFREKRLKRFIEGKAKATADERRVIEWTRDIVFTIMDAVDTEDNEEQVQLMLDAAEIAAEELSGDVAPGVVRAIRDIISNGPPSFDDLQRGVTEE